MKKSGIYGFLPTVLVLPLLLSACRFGNHTENAVPLPQPSLYSKIELYFTQAVQLETAAVLNSIDGPDSVVNSNPNAPLTAIPANVRRVFTNPVYFAVPKDTTDAPMFVDIVEGAYAIYTELDSAGKIDSKNPSGEYQFYESETRGNPGCTTQWQVSQDGSFDLSHPGYVTVDGQKKKVSGDLRLTYSFIREFYEKNPGDCAEDLTYLASCYTDGRGCSNDDLDYAQGIFDLYVRQTGVLNIDDAAKLKALVYIAHYQ